MHFASQLLPLITIPYLTRILGPSVWGLVAMAQAFGMYANVMVDYGFVYSASRDVVTADTPGEVERIVAGVSGAKLLLAAAGLLATALVYLAVPLFRAHPLLLWTAVTSEVVKALLPVYYFYGIKRVALASLLDIGARALAAAGIFLLVKHPADAWKIFALNGVLAIVAVIAGHALIRRRFALRPPSFAEGWHMLRAGWTMFVFRSAFSVYTLGNAFVLGLFAPPQAVGYYAGAEKIGSAAVGVLNPLTTVLYPRAAETVKASLHRGARITRLTLYFALACSVALALLLWFGAPLIVRLILGHSFEPSAGVLQILSLRAPLVAWTNILGFQWLLVLGLEREFQWITVAAMVLNVALAAALAPSFSYRGMAWAVLVSQSAAALGILLVLQKRKLNPFAGRLVHSHA